MSTEYADIVVREDGSVVVRRRFDDIASSGEKAMRSVDLLNRSLMGIGVTVAVRELIHLSDAYTTIQNKLSVTAKNTNELQRAMSEVYAISQRTRSSFEATAQLYSRLALSSKELGISQQRLLSFTESLNKAVIISGATAAEASAGLIQLSQGIASGRIQGDELRSVLEQLPKVADIISQHLNITRGELRKMGSEGKLTAGAIINAFEEAKASLDSQFAKTVPTIAQSFTVLRNAAIQWIGEVGTGTGIQSAFAQGLLVLANNLNLVGEAVTTLGAVFLARWVSGALVSAFAATAAYVTELVALEFALGATTVTAASTGAGLKLLQYAFIGLTSTTAVLTLGLTAVAAGLAMLWLDARQAQEVMAGLADNGRAAANDLLDLEEKLRKAGVSVNTLKTAASDSNPFIRNLALAYGTAADEAFRLAKNARDAAVAILQTKVTELRGQRSSITTPIRAAMSGDPILAAGGAIHQFGSEALGGPSVQQRLDTAKSLSDTIDIYQRQINELNALTDKQIATIYKPQPLSEDPTGGKDTAAQKLMKLKNALEQVLHVADPIQSALMHIARNEITLNQAVAAGLITTAQKIEYSNRLKQAYEQQLNPLGYMVKQMHEEAITNQLGSRERAIEIDLRQRLLALQKDGVEITPAVIQGMRDEVTLLQQSNEQMQVRDQLLGETVEKRRQLLIQLNEINRLQADPNSGFTKTDAFNSFTSATGSASQFAGTQMQIDAQITAYQTMYDQIAAMRVTDIEGERSRAQALAAIDTEIATLRLQGAQAFFGALAGLANSKNRELAAIGKAAAIAQASVNTYLAASNALAHVPFPFNYAAAAAVTVAGLAQVAQIAGIKGFAQGGYVSGPGGASSDSINASLSNGEFVMNASATRRNRGLLEALNSNRPIPAAPTPTGGGGGMNVQIVNNHSGARVEARHLSPTDVMIMIHEEVPKINEREFAQPNSKSSRALSRSTNVDRKRG